MQNVFSNLCYLCLIFLVFSCTKDAALDTPDKINEPIQALEGEEESPCDEPCQQPESIAISNISGCSATVSWTSPNSSCGNFQVQLQNMNTGTWTFFNIVSNPYFLIDLEPCTEYKVGVSHVTDFCASIPLQTTFQTDCEPCENICETPCRPVDFLNVVDITQKEATVQFGHDSPLCGSFSVQVKNNVTNQVTYYDPATNPLSLTGLDPCTSYTVNVSHLSTQQACLPTSYTFTTECDPCNPEGLDVSMVSLDRFGFDVPGVIGVWSNYIEYEILPLQGYRNVTSPVLRLQPFTYYTLMYTYTIDASLGAVETYINMWIDFNDDGIFDSTEEVLDFDIYNGSLDFGGIAPLVIPDNPGCDIKGRIMISIHEDITSPCNDIADGHVVDFLVDIGDCL